MSETAENIYITIIVATYNSEKYLEGCIRSIVNQSYPYWELLIIDGKSTDKTVDIITSNIKYVNAWLSEDDDGIYDAWNKGIKMATGDWICFVGSDDLLYPDALSVYASHISNHLNNSGLEFVSSNIEIIDENAKSIKTVGAAWNWNEFKKSMITWHVGCMHSRSLFNRYGLFDTSFKISGDYELLLRASNNLKTSYINRTTVKMRNGGVSSKQLMLASQETYRAKIKNNVLSATTGTLLMHIDRIRLYLRQ